MLKEIHEKTAALFWLKVNKMGAAECWPWMASVDPNGYGRFGTSHWIAFAHRVAWELTNGPIPTGLCVCHHCDNPRCCNPSHLFVGDRFDNMRDMAAKGRASRGIDNNAGESNGRARLSAVDVAECRRLVRSGSMTRTELARRYGVSSATMIFAVNGHSWKTVAEPVVRPCGCAICVSGQRSEASP